MKLRNLVILALAGLALLAGAYAFGRWDAPTGSDQRTSSLLAGLRAYHDRYNEMTRQLAAARVSIEQGRERERKLAARRTVTPRLVPANCAPWAENLSTCDQQVAELRNGAQDAARVLGLTDQARRADSARADTLTKALKREVGKGKILGITLPSRRTSFAAGAAGGAVLCFLFCPR